MLYLFFISVVWVSAGKNGPLLEWEGDPVESIGDLSRQAVKKPARVRPVRENHREALLDGQRRAYKWSGNHQYSHNAMAKNTPNWNSNERAHWNQAVIYDEKKKEHIEKNIKVLEDKDKPVKYQKFQNGHWVFEHADTPKKDARFEQKITPEYRRTASGKIEHVSPSMIEQVRLKAGYAGKIRPVPHDQKDDHLHFQKTMYHQKVDKMHQSQLHENWAANNWYRHKEKDYRQQGHQAAKDATFHSKNIAVLHREGPATMQRTKSGRVKYDMAVINTPKQSNKSAKKDIKESS